MARTWAGRVATLGTAVLLLGHLACPGSDEIPEPYGFVPALAGPSWAPRPQRLGGLGAVAQVRGDRFLLHTEHGDVDFLPGVNLGSTTPGHQPGEVAMSAEDVRRWLPMMGQFGFRVLRIYTILPPHFYTELAAYNEKNEGAPLYLMQGVYLPDETYVETGDLFVADATAAFRDEIHDAVAAVHGDLSRAPRRGRSSGQWTADVTPWLAGWIIGAELDPIAIHASDTRNADAPAYQGRYFVSTEGASPTERWLAARMDELATAEAGRGHTAPLAFVNWPTVDPLEHPEEPQEREDMVGIDANRVAATDAWPAGTFASYHAYPYYPDFQRHEPGLQMEWRGEIDPYAGYLLALKRHHAGMPVMITEFGVPASLGSAHNGTLGRDQGGHSEQEALAMDADMLRTIDDLDLAGGLVFAWTDEWFKFTWNTVPRQIPPDRRQQWHDPLTNEQYFGLVATDAVGTQDAQLRVIAEDREMTVWGSTDETWVHLRIDMVEEPSETITLGFDVVAGSARRLPGSTTAGEGADYAVVLDPGTRDGQAWVRARLDPIPLDNLRTDPRPPAVDGWLPQQLTINAAMQIPTTGERLPVEFFDIGNLRHGHMDPDHPDYDSRNTWLVDDSSITLRMPWGLLGLADPSSKQALLLDSDGRPATVPVSRIGLVVHAGDRRVETTRIAWEPWQQTHYQERVKAGAQAYVDAVYDVTPR